MSVNDNSTYVLTVRLSLVINRDEGPMLQKLMCSGNARRILEQPVPEGPGYITTTTRSHHPTIWDRDKVPYGLKRRFRAAHSPGGAVRPA